MKYIIFVNGYRSTESIVGTSGRRYLFRKKFVTAVDDVDSVDILNKTSRDIPWCPRTPKTEPPFEELDVFCKRTNQSTKEYMQTHLLNQ